jgi:hypothetical protein
VVPVPSDLDIAQGCVPLPISVIAEELGLARDDYDEHGKQKAKARARELYRVCACERARRAQWRGAMSVALGCECGAAHEWRVRAQVKLSLLEKLADRRNGYYGAPGAPAARCVCASSVRCAARAASDGSPELSCARRQSSSAASRLRRWVKGSPPPQWGCARCGARLPARLPRASGTRARCFARRTRAPVGSLPPHPAALAASPALAALARCATLHAVLPAAGSASAGPRCVAQRLRARLEQF